MKTTKEIEDMREVLEQKSIDDPENSNKWLMYRFVLGQRVGLREIAPNVPYSQHQKIFKEVAIWIGNYIRPDTKLTDLHRLESGEI